MTRRPTERPTLLASTTTVLHAFGGTTTILPLPVSHAAVIPFSAVSWLGKSGTNLFWLTNKRTVHKLVAAQVASAFEGTFFN